MQRLSLDAVGRPERHAPAVDPLTDRPG